MQSGRRSSIFVNRYEFLMLSVRLLRIPQCVSLFGCQLTYIRKLKTSNCLHLHPLALSQCRYALALCEP